MDNDELTGVVIGSIGNYYGQLEIAEHDGRYWWTIENYSGKWWEEIPKSLFDGLKSFNANSKNA